MEKGWTENSAKSKLMSNGIDIKGKMIRAKSGLKGLTLCSAHDFLVNYCGYMSNLRSGY